MMPFMEITRFGNPHLLWLLLLLLPLVATYAYRAYRGGAAIRVSTTASAQKAGRTFRHYLRHVPFFLLCCASALMIVALARPQNSEYGTSSNTEGIDIVLAMDVSTSMLARDLTPDRISAAKEVAARFIVDRTSDRLGIVIFAGESFTQSPLTTDKRTLLNLMGQVRTDVIDDGTAIGNGLGTAINRLRESEAKSKVVILLTDGVNNAGEITPVGAADIAKAYGIKVYTIGVGREGMAPYPFRDPWGRVVLRPAKVEIDEHTLRRIAETTGGEYFRATDNESLAQVYERIDRLEKSAIETSDYTRYNELYGAYLLAAMVLLGAAFLLQTVVLKRIP